MNRYQIMPLEHQVLKTPQQPSFSAPPLLANVQAASSPSQAPVVVNDRQTIDVDHQQFFLQKILF